MSSVCCVNTEVTKLLATDNHLNELVLEFYAFKDPAANSSRLHGSYFAYPNVVRTETVSIGTEAG